MTIQSQVTFTSLLYMNVTTQSAKKRLTTSCPAAKTLKTQQVEGFRIREKPAIFLVVINRDIYVCTRKTFAWSRFFAKVSLSVKP